MARSTAPILLAGGTTFTNEWLGNGQKPDFTVLVATGIAAGGFALLEQVPRMGPVAGAIAWLAFGVMLIVPPKSGRSPAENLQRLTGV